MKINFILPILATVVIMASCKKNDSKKDDTQVTNGFKSLPDSTMFLTRLDTTQAGTLGTTIYVLNAATGALSAKYHYAYQPETRWCFPAVGNGFLYRLENSKIDAINPNTGDVLWTDTVNNYSVPVLHNATFYGVYLVNNTFKLTPPYVTSTYGIYALDATKHSKSYLWKYEITDNQGLNIAFPFDNYSPEISPLIRYYNGTIYLAANSLSIVALDPQTGTVKWKISNTSSLYSLSTLNNGIIMAGNTAIDANTGNQVATVTPTNVPPVYGQQTSIGVTLEYASPALYFVKTTHFNTPPGLSTSYLSAVDRITGAEKWRTIYGRGQVDYDTVYQAKQLWNNQLVVKKVINTGAGKYGVSHAENYRLMNMDNGAATLTFDDLNKGITTESFIVNNTMYFHKKEYSIGAFTLPAVNFLFSIDLFTGKQKWNNNQLLSDYSGDTYSCVFVSGKGYSPFIQ